MGLRKQFINNFVFLTWACAAGFNNNNTSNVIHEDRQAIPSVTNEFDSNCVPIVILSSQCSDSHFH